MSDQTTASKTPAEPILCKQGCGFFGNGATDGCCSKCWRDLQLKKAAPAAPAVCAVCKPPHVEEAQPMDVEAEEASAPMAEPAPVALPKKKKSKTSYKNMMAGMMQGAGRDIKEEKESLRKVTGGGAFSKIEKI